MEKNQTKQPVEVVQQSKPTPTRVLGPQDLEILQEKLHWEEAGGEKKQSRAARHEIEIRNNGSVPYAEIQLRFDYLDRKGKTLASKTHTSTQGVLPGSVLKITDIIIPDLPLSAADSRATIAYGDLKPAPPQSR